MNHDCLSFHFFSFSWSLTTCFFVALNSCVYSCPKLSIIIHIFGIHFQINLLYLYNLKTNYGTTTTPYMRTNEIKTKSKPSHVTFKCANPIFFNKKMKIGRPEHSLNPHTPTCHNILFLPYPPPPQSGRHMFITP